MNDTRKRPGPVRLWKAPTMVHVQVERGELELLRQVAQRDKRRVSDMIRERIVPLIADARQRFPKLAADLEARGLL